MVFGFKYGFLPKDDYEQAEVLQWMFFEQFSHEPNLATSRYWISILNAENEYLEQLKEKKKAGYVNGGAFPHINGEYLS